MTVEPMPAIEPVTDEDYAAACANAFFLGLRPVLEKDRRRVAERQAGQQGDHNPTSPSHEAANAELAHISGTISDALEIERLRAEVAQADADYNDAVTLAQMNLDLLKAVEAEVAALKAACAQKDGALGICRAMLSVVHDVGQFTRSTKVAIGVAESALSTDAGKGWIDATGAVEATCFSHCEVIGREPFGTYRDVGRVEVPKDWAGSRVLIVRVAK